jgi:hypothetical protein
MRGDYQSLLATRLQRQRAFFSRGDAGDLLVYVRSVPNLEGLLYESLPEDPVPLLRAEGTASRLVGEYVQRLREDYPRFYALDNDALPAEMAVYAGIGSITAAMTGRQARFVSGTSWCDAQMTWEEIAALRFDAANPWVVFAEQVNRAVWHYWEGDYLPLPYLHRSPLDAANGIRGNQLFADLVLEPQKASQLIDWCAEWSIQLEKHLRQQVTAPPDAVYGQWGTYLPAQAVFVNGDPADLISRPMQQLFERPYTEKLFSAVGGGFFHHHGIGRYQVDQIAMTGGMLVQEILDDPTCPATAEVMLTNPLIREKIVQASLQVPIMIHHVPAASFRSLLPIVAEGRFILYLTCETDDEARDCVSQVRKISNLS